MKSVTTTAITYIGMFTIAFLLCTSFVFAHEEESVDHSHEEERAVLALHFLFGLSGFLLGAGVGFALARNNKMLKTQETV